MFEVEKPSLFNSEIAQPSKYLCPGEDVNRNQNGQRNSDGERRFAIKRELGRVRPLVESEDGCNPRQGQEEDAEERHSLHVPSLVQRLLHARRASQADKGLGEKLCALLQAVHLGADRVEGLGAAVPDLAAGSNAGGQSCAGLADVIKHAAVFGESMAPVLENGPLL